MIVTIAFEITEGESSGTPGFVISTLENHRVLWDLANRAACEFKRDLARRYNFAPIELDVTLLDAYTMEK